MSKTTTMQREQRRQREMIDPSIPIVDQARAAWVAKRMLREAHEDDTALNLARKVFGHAAPAELGDRLAKPGLQSLTLPSFEVEGYLIAYRTPAACELLEALTGKPDPRLVLVERCHACGIDWTLRFQFADLADFGRALERFEDQERPFECASCTPAEDPKAA